MAEMAQTPKVDVAKIKQDIRNESGWKDYIDSAAKGEIEAKRGDVGPDVEQLQKALNSYYKACGINKQLETDGKFGRKTEDALRFFQASYKNYTEGAEIPTKVSAMMDKGTASMLNEFRKTIDPQTGLAPDPNLRRFAKVTLPAKPESPSFNVELPNPTVQQFDNLPNADNLPGAGQRGGQQTIPVVDEPTSYGPAEPIAKKSNHKFIDDTANVATAYSTKVGENMFSKGIGKIAGAVSDTVTGKFIGEDKSVTLGQIGLDAGEGILRSTFAPVVAGVETINGLIKKN